VQGRGKKYVLDASRNSKITYAYANKSEKNGTMDHFSVATLLEENN
jgi:hypothetical protein